MGNTSKDNWTMTHLPDIKKYTLTCLDNSFDQQEMAVRVKCAGLIMTDDLYVNVKARSASLKGNNIEYNAASASDKTISYSGSTNYSITITLPEKTTRVNANQTGWLENQYHDIKASGTVTASIPVTTKTIYPNSSGYIYRASSDSIPLLRYISVEGVDLSKVHTSFSCDITNEGVSGSNFVKYDSFRNDEILIAGSGNKTGRYSGFVIQNISGATDESWSWNVSGFTDSGYGPGYWYGNRSVGEGSILICESSEVWQSSNFQYKWYIIKRKSVDESWGGGWDTNYIHIGTCTTSKPSIVVKAIYDTQNTGNERCIKISVSGKAYREYRSN